MVLYVLPLVLVGAFIYFYRKTSQHIPKGLSAAPGPKPLPLIGNAHQLGPYPHRQIQRWAQEYGEIYKIRLGWNDWYMLCSPSAVKEVLDRQSAHSSSRAPAPVASDALSGGMRFLFMEYGNEWRRLRSVSHKLLTPAASALFKPSQEWEGRLMLEEILSGADMEGLKGWGKREEGSEVGYMAVRRYTVSVIMTSTYGRRIPEWVSMGKIALYEDLEST